jgi:GntR family transcriptional regulator, carbon starvation induced regulator
MTLAETAYGALRYDIVRGALTPGQPLRLAVLSERYGMGFSPLREALNRLQAERLVTSVALRGFSVAPLSMADMWDATNTRILIEQRALRLSITQGDDTWEAGIVGALHALMLQATRAASGQDEQLRALEDRHHAFHQALIGACGSSWLMDFFQRLYVEAERYRYPMLSARSVENHRDIQAEHSALAQAVLARQADQACDLLAEHYSRTARFIQAQATGPTSSKSA